MADNSAVLDNLYQETLKSRAPAAKAAPKMDDIYKNVTGREPPKEIYRGSPEEKEAAYSYLGRDPGVDYNKGANLKVRYNMMRASNPDEEAAYLENEFGRGNYRQDRGGNWLFKDKEGWKPVYPAGVMEGLETGGAAAAAVAPQVGMSIGGAILGAPGGPPGIITGAVGGSLTATAADEAAKKAQGFYRKTPEQLAGQAARDAALNAAFEGAPRALHAARAPFFNASSRALGRFGGVTPEARNIAQELDRRLDITGPVASVAPGLRAFEYDRMLRNIVATDPMLAPRQAAMNTRIREVLRGFGFQGGSLQTAERQINDRLTALSGHEAGEDVIARLRDAEEAQATRGTAADTRRRQLLIEATANEGRAKQAITDAYKTLNDVAQRDVGSLGSNVAAGFEHERGVFNDQMRQAYGAVHAMAGGRKIVPTDAIRQEAQELVSTMDPQAVPPIIKRWASPPADSGGAPAPPSDPMEAIRQSLERKMKGGLDAQGEDAGDDRMTIEEAHNLRTALREMSQIRDLSPIGQRAGNLRQMAAAVDDALVQAGDQAGGSVAAALKEADEAYAQGIVKFTNADINNLVREVRAGRMPDAEKVADMLIDKDSAEKTKQVWDVLPPELQRDVRTVDLRNMIHDSSTVGKDGVRELNPDALLKALDERSALGFVYDKNFVKSLRDLALDAKALDGSVDVTSLPQNVTRDWIERAIGARRSLEIEAKQSGPAAMKALASNNVGLNALGAKYFAMPSHEAVAQQFAQRAHSGTLPGASPYLQQAARDWAKVQRFAVQDLLKSAIAATPRGMASTISGSGIEDYLGKLSASHQRALFGNRLDDIRLIARQARFLFPEHESNIGASLAAANVLGHLPRLSAIRAYTWSQVAGRIADSPTLSRMLAGTIRNDPYAGRAILGYMMQAGANLGTAQIGKQMNEKFDFSKVQPTPPTTLRDTDLEVPKAAVPGARPIPRGQPTRGYGGPME